LVEGCDLPSYPGKQAEPNVTSVYPLTAQRGTTVEAILRGSNLEAARALMFEGNGVEAGILSVDPDEPLPGKDGVKEAKDHPPLVLQSGGMPSVWLQLAACPMKRRCM
jgi:hypothetical protein